MSGGGFIRVWGGYVRLRSVCYKAVLLLYCVARARATSELRALPSYHVPQGSALLWMEAAFRATDDNNICRVFGAPARSVFVTVFPSGSLAFTIYLPAASERGDGVTYGREKLPEEYLDLRAVGRSHCNVCRPGPSPLYLRVWALFISGSVTLPHFAVALIAT